jgi:FkbM family methyltransferase
MPTNTPHLVTARYGRMHLLGRDSIVSESLALYGEWAQREIDFLAHFIAPGSTVLDIGAFIGTHTLAFSALVGDQGTVIAFEPRAEAFDLLTRNVQDNQRTNVHLRQQGVSDAPASIQLHRMPPGAPTNFAGLALDDDDEGPASGPAYEVPLVTVDGLALAAVGLLKIDVEGMERQVLDGARETIASFKPAVFAEANSIGAGLKILAWCQASGYECLGHLTDAFNPENFNGQARSIFDDGKELNLLLLPAGRALPEGLPRVFPIDNADDIAALLLHKPQYPHEVLKLANRAQGPGRSYPSPLAQARQKLEGEVSDLQAEVQSAQATQRAQAVALQAAAEAAQAASQARERLQGELKALQSALDAAEGKADALTARLTQALVAQGRVGLQLADATSDLVHANAYLDALKNQHEAALAELTALRNSRSWKFTAPLRRVGWRVRVVLNRFRPR